MTGINPVDHTPQPAVDALAPDRALAALLGLGEPAAPAAEKHRRSSVFGDTTGEKVAAGILGGLMGLLAIIGMVVSFTTVDKAMHPDFGGRSPLVPLGVDVGILVFGLLDVLLTYWRIQLPIVRWFEWTLVGATIYLNASEHGMPPWVRAAHIVLPLLWVVSCEIVRHVVRDRLDLLTGNPSDPIPLMVWVTYPWVAVRMKRRMIRWQIKSYKVALLLDAALQSKRAKLELTYGRSWKKVAPANERLALRLRERVPANLLALALTADAAWDKQIAAGLGPVSIVMDTADTVSTDTPATVSTPAVDTVKVDTVAVSAPEADTDTVMDTADTDTVAVSAPEPDTTDWTRWAKDTAETADTVTRAHYANGHGSTDTGAETLPPLVPQPRQVLPAANGTARPGLSVPLDSVNLEDLLRVVNHDDAQATADRFPGPGPLTDTGAGIRVRPDSGHASVVDTAERVPVSNPVPAPAAEAEDTGVNADTRTHPAVSTRPTTDTAADTGDRSDTALIAQLLDLVERDEIGRNADGSVPVRQVKNALRVNTKRAQRLLEGAKLVADPPADPLTDTVEGPIEGLAELLDADGGR